MATTIFRRLSRRSAVPPRRVVYRNTGIGLSHTCRFQRAAPCSGRPPRSCPWRNSNAHRWPRSNRAPSPQSSGACISRRCTHKPPRSHLGAVCLNKPRRWFRWLRQGSKHAFREGSTPKRFSSACHVRRSGSTRAPRREARRRLRSRATSRASRERLRPAAPTRARARSRVPVVRKQANASSAQSLSSPGRMSMVLKISLIHPRPGGER
jgi:hypothetical protein